MSSRDTLFVEIADDGIGGADLLGGSGLVGLRDRLGAACCALASERVPSDMDGP